MNRSLPRKIFLNLAANPLLKVRPVKRFAGDFRYRWGPWLNRGTLATLDQGIASGANFVLTVMLARWLSASDYGAYALALSISFLIMAVQQALILEPMSVLGPACYGGRHREYVSALLRLNAVLSFGIAGVLVLLAFCTHMVSAARGLAPAFAALAISLSGSLQLLVVRGGCYLELKPGPAALASLAYGVLALSGGLILRQLGWISPACMLLWMGASAWIATAILLPRFRSLPTSIGLRVGLHEAWSEHWRYGRWALAATPVNWVPENVCYAFAAFGLGTAATGILRAMMNFVVPLLQLCSPSLRLLMPYLSNTASRYGYLPIRARIAQLTLLLAVMGSLYAAVLFFFHEPAFHFLYGRRFDNSADLVMWMGPVTISYVLLYSPLTGLRAIQSPRSVFLAYCCAATVALGGGLPLTLKYGLRGTIMSLCVSNIAGCALAFTLFYRSTQPSRSLPSADDSVDTQVLPTVS